jgi:hypothetical protein
MGDILIAKRMNALKMRESLLSNHFNKEGVL